ncbi:MAG: DUF2284 domain-containing protein [Dehalococcoidales bacterium]|nr:DUF2284 domain-containing protein [Dehalococcoidales bacterium]
MRKRGANENMLAYYCGDVKETGVRYMVNHVRITVGGFPVMLSPEEIIEYSKRLGISFARAFPPGLLIPQERVRGYCRENKCGSYNRNYSCPPSIGTLEEIRERLGQFQQGIILQYSQPAVIEKGNRELQKTKIDFHLKILKLEEFLKKTGAENVMGMPGGSCGLCRTCRAVESRPCRHPGRMRFSLEAAGIDVLGLLAQLGMDNRFYPDKINWTGCVLY